MNRFNEVVAGSAANTPINRGAFGIQRKEEHLAGAINLAFEQHPDLSG